MAYYTDITLLPLKSIPGSVATKVIRWLDDYTDVLYQLYVNGKLTNETTNINATKEFVVTLETGVTFALQVIAIDEADRGIDYGDYLTYTDSIGAKVELKWSASDCEYDSTTDIYYDGETGTIDTDTPLNVKTIENWPTGQGKSGFGFGEFGMDAFGYGGGGMGFGLGAFGIGAFGFDCDYVTWTSRPMPAGSYKFQVQQFDTVGNEDDGSSPVQTVFVDPYPPSPKKLAVKSYTDATKTLVLTVTGGTWTDPYASS